MQGHAFVHVIEQRLKAGVAVAQRGLGALAVADIAGDGQHQGLATQFKQAGVEFERNPFTVAGQQPLFKDQTPLAQQGFRLARHFDQILWRQQIQRRALQQFGA